MKEERFIRIESSKANGTSKILNRDILNPQVFIGDFLSRIWKIYGKPDNVGDEGFDYIFQDTETRLIFTAYAAGSGPAYGGTEEETEKLIPIIKIFDKMLGSVIPADCEIEYETDFGMMKSGAKDGIPYDKSIE